MLKFIKIRSSCQISTTFMNINNYMCNLILFFVREIFAELRKEIAISIYCLLLIDHVPSPIPDKIIAILRVRLALQSLVYRYRR